MPDQSFPANVRLKKSEQFQAVFAKRRSVADHNLVVYAIRNGTSETRIGLAVGKKVGNAVTRNHWKRMLREAFRLSREELPAGYDLVVLPRKGVTPELKELRKSLGKLVRRLDRR